MTKGQWKNVSKGEQSGKGKRAKSAAKSVEGRIQTEKAKLIWRPQKNYEKDFSALCGCAFYLFSFCSASFFTGMKNLREPYLVSDRAAILEIKMGEGACNRADCLYLSCGLGSNYPALYCQMDGIFR